MLSFFWVCRIVRYYNESSFSPSIQLPLRHKPTVIRLKRSYSQLHLLTSFVATLLQGMDFRNERLRNNHGKKRGDWWVTKGAQWKRHVNFIGSSNSHNWPPAGHLSVCSDGNKASVSLLTLIVSPFLLGLRAWLMPSNWVAVKWLVTLRIIITGLCIEIKPTGVKIGGRERVRSDCSVASCEVDLTVLCSQVRSLD